MSSVSKSSFNSSTTMASANEPLTLYKRYKFRKESGWSTSHYHVTDEKTGQIIFYLFLSYTLASQRYVLSPSFKRREKMNSESSCGRNVTVDVVFGSERTLCSTQSTVANLELEPMGASLTSQLPRIIDVMLVKAFRGYMSPADQRSCACALYMFLGEE